MKILYIIDGTGVGGAETLLLDILRVARDRNHEAHLAYFTPGPLGPEMEALAASTTRLSKRGLKDPLALWRALRLIRRLRPDVVHTHLTKSDLVGQVAARLAGVPRRIVTLHNTDRWRQKAVLAALYRRATAGAHRLVAVSETVADYVRQTGSGIGDRLVVIPNGVDLARFRTVPPLTPKPDGAPVTFAIIGRLQPQKDHRTFLKAAAILAPRWPNAKFLVIGDGPLRAELEAEAQALGLGSRLQFTGNRSDMVATLTDIDALVLSSAWEGLPMVLLEAMAAARPVVATAVGEIPQVLRHGVDGLVVPPSQPERLAEAMETLLRFPNRGSAMGISGRERVTERHDAATMHDRIFAIYAGT
ncbi:glycosyltransferase family 4 protein [Tabrizicola sp.]|uniref:glycosyltransferase family 4 protein n=1 Tax=Tabrizicola sp. TaxID=2005166 RepID=UPI003F31987A